MEFDEATGINLDEAAEEARSLIPDLKPGGELGYLSHSTCGHLRVGLSRNGQLFVTGHGNEAQRAMAEKIAAQIGAIVP